MMYDLLHTAHRTVLRMKDEESTFAACGISAFHTQPEFGN
jgi:hypothetical protein